MKINLPRKGAGSAGHVFPFDMIWQAEMMVVDPSCRRSCAKTWLVASLTTLVTQVSFGC